MNYVHKQQGLSLIELMISIALSMVLMGAALQFIFSSRQTFEINDDISRVQENGRVALDIIARDVQMSGYRRRGGSAIDKLAFVLQSCVKEKDGTTAPCTKDGGTNNSDTLSIMYDPLGDIDCLGNATAADIALVNVYSVDDIDGDGVNSLYCRGYDAQNENWLGAAQPLIDGIDNMQVLYGIADTSLDDPSVTAYISADQLTATNVVNIQAVRIAMLASNGLDSGNVEKRARSYRLLDSDSVSFDDKQSRRIYSTTIQLNNRNN
jgi:type IV pilus assembly protein PilW